MGFLFSARLWSDRHLEVAYGHDIASSTLGSSAEDLPFLALGARGTQTPTQLLRVGSQCRAIIDARHALRTGGSPPHAHALPARARRDATRRGQAVCASRPSLGLAFDTDWWLVGGKRAAGSGWIVGGGLAALAPGSGPTTRNEIHGRARLGSLGTGLRRAPRSCRPRTASGSSVPRYDPTENWNEKTPGPMPKKMRRWASSALAWAMVWGVEWRH
jgi:hypothetical protein